MAELLPCPNPFAKDHSLHGAPWVVNMSLAVYEGKYHSFRVACGCGLHGEQKSDADEATARAAAILAWNTRAPIPATPGEDRVNVLMSGIRSALDELGVPTPEYPAPVTEAVCILTTALGRIDE